MLRIEDLDLARCSEADSRAVIDDLLWLGFDFDGEVYYQSRRAEIYADALKKISRKADIYPCWCTRGSLAATAPHGADGHPIYDGRCRRLPPDAPHDRPPCLRVAVPDRVISLTDRLQGGYRQNLAAECGDFILRRADGVYAYQLAVVVDDALSGVTEVVRGLDLLPSAPRQMFLYECLGYPPPSYCHTPLLLGPDGKRLAKRDGAYDIGELRKRFASPEPIIGALAYCAGVIDRPDELSLSELIPLFDISAIKTDNIIFLPSPLWEQP